MKPSEDEQRYLGDLVDKLRHELEQLATDEHDKLEWYIEEMQKRAAKLSEQSLSFYYEKLVECIFAGGMKVEVVGAHWSALEKAFRRFDPEFVSKCTVEELLQEPGIIKHEGKLRGCILAAKFFLEIEREFGSFYSFCVLFPNILNSATNSRACAFWPMEWKKGRNDAKNRSEPCFWQLELAVL